MMFPGEYLKMKTIEIVVIEGKQTWLTWLEGEGTSLIFEGIHFEIIDNE